MNDDKLIKPAIIDPIQYDRITDDIYTIGKNVVLRFSVGLSKSFNDQRIYFHKEYEYSSKYNNDPKTLITVKRNYDFYYSIENVLKDENTGTKEFIRIGITEILLFEQKLKQAVDWFTSKEFESLYAKRMGKLIMLGKPESIKITGLPMEKFIIFEPTICIYETSTYPGIRMYLSSYSNYVDISIDRLMGLYYIISRFDMYNAALSMINYIERPPFGTNLVTFDKQSQYQYIEPEYEKIKAKEGRKIKPKSNKSSFSDLE